MTTRMSLVHLGKYLPLSEGAETEMLHVEPKSFVSRVALAWPFCLLAVAEYS